MQPSHLPESAACTAFLSPKATAAVLPRTRQSASAGELRVCRADLGRDDLSGLSLGQYDLGKRLGAGGMGLVYEAKHRHLGKTFAVKFIRNEVNGDEATGRFLQEIRTLGTLQHANVISAVDAGVEQHLPYCVTELLAGHDLSSWIDTRGPLPLGAAAEVIRQAAEGLACAHAQNIIHRDIKPSNLFLQFDGTVKLLDFGLSVCGDATNATTEPGRLLGTIEFMSPEQIQDAHSVTGVSDLYSLGASFFYLLTGKLLYDDSLYPSAVNKVRAIGQSPEQLLEPQSSQFPTSVKQLLTTLLEPNPGNRCSSAARLSELLQPLAGKVELTDWLQGQNGETPVVAPEQSISPILRQRKFVASAYSLATLLLLAGAFAIRSAIRASSTSQQTVERSLSESANTDIATPIAAESEAQASAIAENPSSPEPAVVYVDSGKSIERQTISGTGRTSLSAGAIDFSAASSSKRSSRSRASKATPTD